MSTEERRAPGATRFPFDALVEVGGALGPTFEAQAVNVSEEGLQLRTAYLPEPGQPLTCRFDAGPSGTVLAAGEVAWAQGGERGGEFGVRFTEIDVESVEALKHVCGVGAPPARDAAPAPAAGGPPGSKVRLHIDGLASPMRAKVKDAKPTAITVGSDLGFLQVGRQLELEDAQSGTKRPASIDRVEVALDPASQIPQLVVTLRYGDAPASVAAPARAEAAPGPRPPSPSASAVPPMRRPSPSVEQAALEMKGALARGLEKVRPAMGRLVDQIKATAQLLASRRAEGDASPRRTTAPPPGGGLYAAGRRVVRGDAAPVPDAAPLLRSKLLQRKAVIAGGVMAVAVAGALLLKKGHHEPAPQVAASVAPEASAAPMAAASNAAPTPPPAAPSAAPPAPSPVALAPQADSDDESEGSHAHRKHVQVTPFANGPVHHANVLRLKMDGTIDALEGAQQPTGFLVKIPGRKSLEAAGPLAARDARIAAIKVANDSAGAALSVTFKDGVPNYRVSARGDTLVIALAPEGPIEHAVADKDEKGGRSAKHGKHGHASRADKTQEL